MYKKHLLLWGVGLFCILQAVKADSRNFIVWLNVNESYADVEKVSEAHETTVIDREWCAYFMDKDVEFGEKVAALTSILQASDSYSDDNEDQYKGDKNFMIFNAYILSQYNLPKADYNKMNPYDAAMHLLFSMGNTEDDSDTTQLRHILKRMPNSLALNTLMSASICYFTAFQKMPRAQVVIAKNIVDNMGNYKQDIRLSGAQELLDPIFQFDPCNQNSSNPEAVVCKCSGDGNADRDKLVACVQKMQADVFEKLSAKMNENNDYQLLAKWMTAENEFIATQFYPTVGETEARQALNRQTLITEMSYKTSGIEATGYGLWQPAKLIAYYHPDQQKTLEKYVQADNSYESDPACRTYFYKQLDAILNELYKKLGGAERADLRTAQRAWLAWFESNRKEYQAKIANGSIMEEKLLLDILINRVNMWTIYTCPASILQKMDVQGKQIYDALNE